MGRLRVLTDAQRAENRVACLARSRALRAEHIATKAKELRRNNPTKARAAARKWRAANAEKQQSAREQWLLKNPGYMTAKAARRKAQKLQATPSWGNEFFIQEAYDLARLRTATTSRVWHVDHIVPLKHTLVCGLHVEHNLQVIPAVVNLRKGNRHWPGMPQQQECS